MRCGPVEESGTDDGHVQRQSLGGIGRVVPGEVLDLRQSIGDGADGHVESARRLGGDGAGGEVGLHGVQQRLGAAPRAGERLEQGVDQVDQRLVVAGQDAVEQQVAGLDDVVVVVQPPGQQPRLASLLVGTRDPVRPRVGSAGRRPASGLGVACWVRRVWTKSAGSATPAPTRSRYVAG